MLVISAIDLIAGRCVRLYQGDYSKTMSYEKDPVDQARHYQMAGFSRVHVIDLEGARLGSGENRAVIRKVVDATDVPVQVGGGIRTSEDVSELLGWGVNYLILGTVALENPEIVAEWIDQWGAASFIVSLDFKGNQLRSRGWVKSSRVVLDEIVSRIEGWGINQVVCTDVERDGTLEEPGYETHRNLRGLLPHGIKLIAAGGISSPEHIAKLQATGLQGVVIGRALYEGNIAWEDFLHAG